MRSPLPTTQTPKQRALLIGVSAYSEQRGFTSLKYPQTDVEHLRRVLSTGPNPYDVRYLTDRADAGLRPDSQNVQRQLRLLLEGAGPEDRVLFYFSGHGLSRGEDTWLMPGDVYRDNPEVGALSIRELRQRFMACRAAVKILIVDACHASVPGHRGFVLELEPGEAADDLPQGETVVDLSRALPKSAGRGFAFIASCAHSQLSWEHPMFKMGVFTHFLVKGLSGAACEHASIGLDVLFQYVSQEVARFSQESGCPQTPIYQTEVSEPIVVHTLDTVFETPHPTSHPLLGGRSHGLLRHALPSAAPLELEPYRFFSAYTEADQAKFFGRELEIQSLCGLVQNNSFVLMKAASGAGKTSLLRAGLFPSLQESHALFYSDCRGDIVSGLVSALDSWSPLQAVSVGEGSRSAVRLIQSASSPSELAGQPAQQKGAGSGEAAGGSQGPERLAEALRRHYQRHKRRPVLVLDQLERVLLDAPLGTSSQRPGGSLEDALAELPALQSWSAGAETVPFCVVLAIREDLLYLADGIRRRLEIPPDRELRLELLGREQAMRAICAPVEGQVTYTPALLERLLTDLLSAGRDVNAAAGIPERAGIYPPHLQLVCHDLFHRQILPQGGRGTLQEGDYEGLTLILSRQIEGALEYMNGARRQAARALLKALVGVADTRVAVPEQKLVRELSARFGAAEVAHAVTVLVEEKRLVVRPRGAEPPCLELAHDFLVKRIASWSTPEETERRLARERLRAYAYERGRASTFRLDEPGVRSVLAHPDLLEDFLPEDRERLRPTWERCVADRRYYRRRTLIRGLLLTGMMLLALTLFFQKQARDREIMANMGQFQLELVLYDLDQSGHAVAQPPELFPGLTWSLHTPDGQDPSEPGEAVRAPRLQVSVLSSAEGAQRFEVKTPGGPAFLQVTGRGAKGETCRPSLIPLRRLPGYSEREDNLRLRLSIPTCQATRADVVPIPAGPYFSESSSPGGTPTTVGSLRELPTYALDQHEVRNQDFALFACHEPFTGIGMPTYSSLTELRACTDARQPVSAVSWHQARAFCRYFGKDLPTSEQWTKAARGGLTLGPDRLNPIPGRMAPWGNQPPPAIEGAPGGLDLEEQPTSAGLPTAGSEEAVVTPCGEGAPLSLPLRGPFHPFHPPLDVSPYGIEGLALGVQEWTLDPAPELNKDRFRRLRGGSWFDTGAWMIDKTNSRHVQFIGYATGFRCALTDAPDTVSH